MTIAPQILREYPAMNEAQKEFVGHVDGPVLAIAGPGSGKTFGLVLRAANLFLLGKCKPSELILCTFTEKAAYELRDRIAATTQKVEYAEDLSELLVGTIHGICNRIIAQHRHRTPLGSGYETLDDLGQLLFLFEHFDEICGAEASQPYFSKWQTKWGAIEGMRDYFNKITEELVEADALIAAANPFLQQVGGAYLPGLQNNWSHNQLPVSQTDRYHLRSLDGISELGKSKRQSISLRETNRA